MKTKRANMPAKVRVRRERRTEPTIRPDLSIGGTRAKQLRSKHKALTSYKVTTNPTQQQERLQFSEVANSWLCSCRLEQGGACEPRYLRSGTYGRRELSLIKADHCKRIRVRLARVAGVGTMISYVSHTFLLIICAGGYWKRSRSTSSPSQKVERMAARRTGHEYDRRKV